MRDIKFRGYCEEKKSFIFGFLSKHRFYDNFEILDKNGVIHRVIEDSVGQFTGLNDKNGKDIYEGDILRYQPTGDWDKINYSCFEVFFHDGDSNSDYNIGFSMNRMYNHGSVCGGYIPSFKPNQVSKMIIIGNIYENKNLLK